MDNILEVAAKPDRLLRRTEAAKYVTETYGFPCSPKTLAKLACVSSDGPPFCRAGRIPCIRNSASTIGREAKSGPLFDRPPRYGAFPNPSTKTRRHDSLAGTARAPG